MSNPYAPPQSPVTHDEQKPAGGRWFIGFAVLVLLHSAVWASYAGTYWKFVLTGEMSVVYFVPLFITFATAVTAGLRVVFRAPPPVVAFSLSTVFGLVAVRHSPLIFGSTGLALSIVGVVACLVLRHRSKSKQHALRAEA